MERCGNILVGQMYSCQQENEMQQIEKMDKDNVLSDMNIIKCMVDEWNAPQTKADNIFFL